AFHRADHDHIGGGIRFHRDASSSSSGHNHGSTHSHSLADRHGHGHHHDAGPWHTHEPAALPDRSPEEQEKPSHGEGSLAHFAYALGEEAPLGIVEVSKPLIRPPVVWRREAPAARPGFFRPSSVRGPPSASRA